MKISGSGVGLITVALLRGVEPIDFPVSFDFERGRNVNAVCTHRRNLNAVGTLRRAETEHAHHILGPPRRFRHGEDLGLRPILEMLGLRVAIRMRGSAM